MEIKLNTFYDTYDYLTFWRGRDYENKADLIAVSRLLRRIKEPHIKIIEIGAGSGRIIPAYEDKWKLCILLDSSSVQLQSARRAIKHPENSLFIQGMAESIPLPDNSCDTAICVRVFHYIAKPGFAISEMARVLHTGGHLVLEIPNAANFKAKILSIFSKKKLKSLSSKTPINHASRKDDVFLNHHPETIAALLNSNGFIIEQILSVSNFRLGLLKKILPLRLLFALERLLQRPLAIIWFGPSIYFLARKNNGVL